MAQYLARQEGFQIRVQNWRLLLHRRASLTFKELADLLNVTMRPKHVIIRSTGCRTCRARKVKCDEARPDCQRCVGSGLQCQGYADPTLFLSENPQHQRESPSSSFKPIDPAFQALSLLALPQTSTSSTEPRSNAQLISTKDCHSISETRHDVVQGGIGDGYMGTSKPAKLQPSSGKVKRLRAKNSKPRSEYDTICPLLSQTTSTATITSLPTTTLFHSELEYQYFRHFQNEVSLDLSGTSEAAIWNYVVLRACNQEPALQQLTISVAALTKAKHSSNMAASHHHFAVRQFGKALRGIQEILATRSNANATRITLIASLLIFCFQNLLGDHEQAVAHVRCALNLMHDRLSTFGRHYSKLRKVSSLPGLEDEVLEVFVRLDNTLKLHMDPSACDSTTSLLEITYLDEEFSLPSTFCSIIEAKKYLDHCQYRAMSSFSRMPNVFMYDSQLSHVPRERIYKELATQMHRWSNAFAPLLARACTLDGDQDFIAAATLQVLALSTYLTAQRICMGGGPRAKSKILLTMKAAKL